LPHPETAGAVVIDVGTGTGRILPVLAEYGFSPIGFDTCANCLEEHTYPFIQADICDLAEACAALPGARADLVLCCDVLEHIAPELERLALENLAAAGRYGAVIGISLFADQGGLHCNLKPRECWLELLQEFWEKAKEVEEYPNHVRLSAAKWALFTCGHDRQMK